MIVVLIAAKMDVGRTPLTEAPPAAVLGWAILGEMTGHTCKYRTDFWVQAIEKKTEWTAVRIFM